MLQETSAKHKAQNKHEREELAKEGSELWSSPNWKALHEEHTKKESTHQEKYKAEGKQEYIKTLSALVQKYKDAYVGTHKDEFGAKLDKKIEDVLRYYDYGYYR